jgi:hemerythrin superfamily protein
MTMTDVQTADDVVSFLKAQHEEIKRLFAEVDRTTGDARNEAFTSLRRLLAVHETAEEEVVHPEAKSTLSNGEAVVDARLTEENEAKQVLADLEKLDVDSPEFEQMFASFQRDVIAHAEAEEREEFAELALRLDDDKLSKMRRAVELAERTAPTRPHAGTESAAANFMVRPFASMLDRARDAIQGKND